MDCIPHHMYEEFQAIIRDERGDTGEMRDKILRNINKNARVLLKEGYSNKEVAAVFCEAAEQIQNEAEEKKWTNRDIMCKGTGVPNFEFIRNSIMKIRIK